MNRKRIEKFLTEKLVYSLSLKEQELIGKYQQEIKKIIDELFDLSKSSILSLNSKETLILRKRFGILDNGKWPPFENIAREMKVNEQIMYKIYYKTLTKLKKYFDLKIQEYYIKKTSKLTSMDYNPTLNVLRNKNINELGLESYIENFLARNEIFNLEILLSYSIKDLKKLRGLGMTALNKIIDKIHSLGLVFIEELTDEEKRTIIKNSEIEVINASSIDWVPLEDKKRREYTENYQIKNLKDLKIAILKKMITDIKTIEYLEEVGIITEDERVFSYQNEQTRTIDTPKKSVDECEEETIITKQNELVTRYHALVEEKKEIQLETIKLDQELKEIMSRIEAKGENHVLSR